MSVPAEGLFPGPNYTGEEITSQAIGTLPLPLPGSASPSTSSTTVRSPCKIITVRSPSLSTALCLLNQWFSSDKLGLLVPHNDTHHGPRQSPPSPVCHPRGMMWAAQTGQDEEEGKEGKE